MALVSNLIRGCVDFIRLVFAEDGLIINVVIRHFKSEYSTQVCIQVGVLSISFDLNYGCII
ncbi:hypothetical protein KFK09_009229 [Dendrobium nobile]|uniref:Uncharacterized protein n=1 Tax=Dendrobium nobile TaxID=94219 RepID=A0A8T3BRQ1_DENNO|nr:hypothetical protein KFK09_009229 [Dendrobium nobile]